ncbi:phosphopantothenate/pantothenate synthetase [Candidatus Micrarchaeota archaeon]|nr:phosphopantothenate/pantothenate synthetase [Candidatus Micrarchaeota archaeon]
MIPKSHPRYSSLLQRHKLELGVKKGITSIQGLIAYGRGEAFDYLLGEKTTKEAKKAIKASAALLLLAKHPVLSINGNTAALAPREFAKLSKILNAPIEINLFHRTKKRVLLISKSLKKLGIKPLGIKRDFQIKGLESERGKVSSSGIGKADVVLIPLEDGDRAEKLVNLGKKTIAIDLNPLSRTSKCSTITIVDNITRALPSLIEEVKKLRRIDKAYLRKIVESFKNKKYQ